MEDLTIEGKRVILNDNGRKLLKQLDLTVDFMAGLVEKGLITLEEKEDMAKQEPTTQRDTLKNRLYKVSVLKFIHFCVILHDQHPGDDIIKDIFGLNIQQLQVQRDKLMGTTSATSQEQTLPPGPQPQPPGASVNAPAVDSSTSITTAQTSEHQDLENQSPAKRRKLSTCKVEFQDENEKPGDYGWILTNFSELEKKGKGAKPVKIAVLDTFVIGEHLKNTGVVPELKHFGDNLPPTDDQVQSLTCYQDCLHGTKCAYVIANLAPNLEIVSYHISRFAGLPPKPEPNVDEILKALDDIDKRNDIDVVSMSFSGGADKLGPEIQKLVQDGLKRLSNKMVLVVAGANEGKRMRDTVGFPGVLDEVIAVGSVGHYGTLAELSPQGPGLDFLMPGVDVEFEKEAISGSSYAAPHLAAAAGLILRMAETKFDEDARIKLKSTAAMKILLSHACEQKGVRQSNKEGFGFPYLNEIDEEFMRKHMPA